MKKIKNTFNKIKAYCTNTVKPYMRANKILSLALLFYFFLLCLNLWLILRVNKLQREDEDLYSEIYDMRSDMRAIKSNADYALERSLT